MTVVLVCYKMLNGTYVIEKRSKVFQTLKEGRDFVSKQFKVATFDEIYELCVTHPTKGTMDVYRYEKQPYEE